MVQIRFGARCIALVCARSGVEEVGINLMGRSFSELIADLLEGLPVGAFRGTGSERNPGLDKVGAQANRLAPFALCLLAVALPPEGHSELIMAKGVVRCPL